jgi:hypothetical protein
VLGSGWEEKVKLDIGDLLGISENGRFVAFTVNATSSQMIADLDSGKLVQCYGRWQDELLGEPLRTSRHYHVARRKKFSAIAFDQDGQILLRSKGIFNVLRVDSGLRAAAGGELTLSVAAPKAAAMALAAFQAIHVSSATRVKMHLATWPDGSRAWLDNRGLLHLRSSDRSIPELSLVLNDRVPLAAWSSDGKMCGRPEFLGDVKSEPAAYFGDIIRRFRQRLR